jgi:hypothetical protein
MTQGYQKVSLYLMIKIQKITSNLTACQATTRARGTLDAH